MSSAETRAIPPPPRTPSDRARRLGVDGESKTNLWIGIGIVACTLVPFLIGRGPTTAKPVVIVAVACVPLLGVILALRALAKLRRARRLYALGVGTTGRVEFCGPDETRDQDPPFYVLRYSYVVDKVRYEGAVWTEKSLLLDVFGGQDELALLYAPDDPAQSTPYVD